MLDSALKVSFPICSFLRKTYIFTANAAQTFDFRSQPLSLLSLGTMDAADAMWVLSLAVPEAEADNPHSKTSYR